MLNLHCGSFGSHCKVIVGIANLLINVGVNEIKLSSAFGYHQNFVQLQ